MIIDCHTHVWESPEQLGRWTSATAGRQRGPRSRCPDADIERHLRAAEPVDMSIVLGFRSYYLGAHVPNDYVAGYVRQYPDRVVGFAGVDPTHHVEAVRDIVRARSELGLKGVSVSPAAQNFHPSATCAMKVYAEAERIGLPVFFDQHVSLAPDSKMEYARPFLLDEVAREFPNLRIVISKMGHPWIEETIVLLGKHANVFADVGGLLDNFWLTYNAMLAAHQAGVMDRVLFGSNFPYTAAATGIETLYSINQFCHGTNLPTIPREQLRQVVERNTLELLGIEAPPAATS